MRTRRKSDAVGKSCEGKELVGCPGDKLYSSVWNVGKGTSRNTWLSANLLFFFYTPVFS